MRRLERDVIWHRFEQSTRIATHAGTARGALAVAPLPWRPCRGALALAHERVERLERVPVRLPTFCAGAVELGL